ncbi:putative abhydrolase domain-containing protein [Abeliophyllum distichum]|uniref:Abhydrolase domain-containing protein n=1 Tax=Abeliophyllum distichum TaxID=126358 RepID=A0ABD1SZ56_9LAMI
MLRRILRAYALAPTQVSPNGWSQMMGGMYLWFRHSFGMEMPLHVFQTVYLAEEVAEEEGQRGGGRLVLFLSLGVSQTLSDRLPLFHKTMEGELVLGVWQLAEGGRRPGAGLGCSKCLRNSQLSSSVRAFKWEHRRASVNLPGGYEEPKLQLHFEPTALPGGTWHLYAAEMDQGKRPRPTLAALTKQRPRMLVPGSAEDSSQRKAIEDLSRAGNKEAAEPPKAAAVEIADPATTCSVPPLQRTLAVNTAGEVVLEGPSKSTPAPEGGSGGAYDSKRRLRELIGAPGARVPDDALRSVPFYPSMGAQAFKKYFTPKWEEFSSHGELEDVLEASLASAIRASAMQMKVLGEFRNQMQEQKRRVAEASKADKEHQQALEGLKAALESAQIAYKQMEADLRESDSNLLNMTKQLDNANAAQKVAAEALEAANVEKRRLQEEAKSRDEEISGLRKELADAEEGKKAAEDGRKEAEAGKKEVEARLANAEADFVANFHNTEAYSNFADYFARIGQQEVMTVLRNDHPDFDVKSLEAKFPPPDAEGEGDS